MMPAFVIPIESRGFRAEVNAGDPRGWASLGPRRARGETQVHDADPSSEPGCSRDHKQPCPDDDGPDGSRDALTGRCETFDGDG